MSLRIQKVDQVYCLSGSIDANQSFEIIRFFKATLQLESSLTLRLMSPSVSAWSNSKYFKEFYNQALLQGKSLNLIDQIEAAATTKVIALPKTFWTQAA